MTSSSGLMVFMSGRFLSQDTTSSHWGAASGKWKSGKDFPKLLLCLSTQMFKGLLGTFWQSGSFKLLQVRHPKALTNFVNLSQHFMGTKNKKGTMTH